MDYRRSTDRSTDRTRQPSTQQPHTARATAKPATAAAQGPRATALPVYGAPAPRTVPMRPGAGGVAPQSHGVRPTPELGMPGMAYDFSTPVILDSVAADLTLSEEETERIKGARDIAALCARWKRNPTFDLEYMPGFERWAGELAAWHDEQLKAKARILGCSVRTINILEELVRCFIENRPPQGVLARRLLLEY